MGQKVIPTGLRLGINQTWNSRWFADNDYAKAAARRSEDPQVHQGRAAALS
jgi:hypothetical protein